MSDDDVLGSDEPDRSEPGGRRSRRQPGFRREDLRAIWATIGPLVVHRPLILAVVVLSFVSGALEASILVVVITAATSGAIAGDFDFALFGLEALSRNQLLLAALGGTAALGVVRLLIARAAALISVDTVYGIRAELSDAYFRSRWEVRAADRSGHFTQLLTTHTARVSTGISTVSHLFGNVLNVIVMVAGAMTIRPLAAVGVLVAVPPMLLLPFPIMRRARVRLRRYRDLELELAGRATDWIEASQEVTTFAIEDGVHDVVMAAADEARVEHRPAKVLMALAPDVVRIVAFALLIVAVAVVAAGSEGALVALGSVIVLLLRAVTYVQNGQRNIAVLNETAPYWTQLVSELERYRASHPVPGLPAPRMERLQLDRVSYAYPNGHSVLDEVSFDIRRGELFGMTGPSGSGKTTTGSLILGLLRPTGGRIVVNDTELAVIDEREWQRSVAVVRQTPHLIPGTVAENIRFLRSNVSDDDVVAAARLANVHDEILDLPLGYDTPAEGGGAGLSGGQRQRVCLARALAGEPTILVLDEPTSALDAVSEQLINDALLGLHDKLTTIVITHRLTTIERCDRVAVIQAGKLAAIGRPADLDLRRLIADDDASFPA